MGKESIGRMKESTLQAKILARLNQIDGVMAVKYPGGIYGKKGFPDIVASVMGVFVALEVKLPGEKPTMIQMEMGNQISKSGGVFEVVDNVEDAVVVVRGVVERQRQRDQGRVHRHNVQELAGTLEERKE